MRQRPFTDTESPMATTRSKEAGELGRKAIEKLARKIEAGEDPAGPPYRNAHDFMFDFFGGELSWDGTLEDDVEAILDHPKFETVARFFEEEHGYDFRAVLTDEETDR